MKDKRSDGENPKISELVAAISEKRRELGLLEWGQVSIHEVIDRLKKQPKDKESTDSESPRDQSTLEKEPDSNDKQE